MKSSVFSMLSVALFVAGVSAQSLTVNTPTNVLSCTPLQISWTGGVAPLTLSVHPGADPNGAALVTFTGLTSSPFTWTSVTFEPNTSLDLTLRDNSGLISQTAPFTVQSGGSTTCLNATGSNAATTVAATGSSGTTATAATTTNAATTTGTTAGTTAQNKGASSASTPSASSTAKSGSSSSGASPLGVPFGVAGVIGAAIAALFV